MPNDHGRSEVYKWVYTLGMEAVLTHLIQRLRDEDCDDAYILRLIADLEATLANYRSRHDDDGEE